MATRVTPPSVIKVQVGNQQGPTVTSLQSTLSIKGATDFVLGSTPQDGDLIAYNSSNGNFTLSAVSGATAILIAQAAFNQANIALSTGNSAYVQANTANIISRLAYNQANTATTIARASYSQANIASASVSAAYNQSNTALVLSQAAYDNSNTKYNKTGGTISGDVQVTGNVSVSGKVDTTTVSNDGYVNLVSLDYVQLQYDPTGKYDAGDITNGNWLYVSSSGLMFQSNVSGQWYNTQFDNLGNIITDGNLGANNIDFTARTGNIINNGNAWNFASDGTIRFPDNSVQGTAYTGFGTDNTATIIAKSAYGQANTATTIGQAAYIQANAGTIIGQAAYSQANTATTIGQASYVQANVATTISQAAFVQANTAYNQANTATIIAQAAFNKANSANLTAQAAFDKANTGGTGSGITYTASATAPVSPHVGDQWYYTTLDVLYEYTNDGTSNNWVDISSAAFSANVATITNNNYYSSNVVNSNTYVLFGTSTGNNEIELFLNGINNSRIGVANNTTIKYDLDVVARRTDSANGNAGYSAKGVVVNNSNTVFDLGLIYEVVVGRNDINYNIDARANTTLKTLNIYATGNTAHTVKWVAIVSTTEVAQ